MVAYDLNSGKATSLELCKDDVILSMDIWGSEIAAGSMGNRNELFIVQRVWFVCYYAKKRSGL